MFAAVNSEEGLVVLLMILFLGAVIAIVIAVYWFPDEYNHPNRKFHYGKWYDTRESVKICGCTREMIIDGKWTIKIISVWKTSFGEFFHLEITETSYPKITAINSVEARRLVNAINPKEAEQIYKDWFLSNKTGYLY